MLRLLERNFAQESCCFCRVFVLPRYSQVYVLYSVPGRRSMHLMLRIPSDLEEGVRFTFA
jgi:hypothetical protein